MTEDEYAETIRQAFGEPRTFPQSTAEVYDAADAALNALIADNVRLREANYRIHEDRLKLRAALRIARPYVDQEWGTGNWQQELEERQALIDAVLSEEEA